MPHKLGSYKGNDTITLTEGDGDEKGFTFGKKKARLIAANLPAVLAFAGVTQIGAAGTQQADPMGMDRQYEDDCQRQTGA